ncbi:MAG: Ig domain-containing protein, partial [Muribaculaceae bacterium]|nr:Ig domain-containing protein [Muribaculaceae bacterium]
MKATSKLLTLLALILLSSISAISINAENRFYIDDFTISSGETKELAINLTNDVAFTGFQADIYLPEGLEVEQEDGEYIFDLTDRKGRDHTLSAERQNNGAIRILSYSLKLKEFSGTSGALVNFRVTASDDFSGNYQIQIKNITFATADQAGVDFESTVCNVVGKCLAESISLNMTEASLKVNETTTLTATVLPETATNKSVTWTSSNEAVARVDANGLVTAIAVGEATITATTTDGSDLSASCKVTVKSGSTGLPISVTPKDGSTVAELQKIVFEFSVEDYPKSMDYDYSKNPLLYNAAGEVVAEGHMGYEDASTYMSIYVTFDAPITAEGVYTLKVPEGAMREYGVENPKLCPAMELTYTIIPVKAESITLDKTEVEIIVGETEFLTVTILPETTSNKTVVWSSSDEEVAVVNEYGVVTALAVGEATITATTADGSNLSASCQVTVVAALAESISLNMTEASIEVSRTTTLTATVLPETATNKTVTWTSSNEAVATVDANGLVTAIAVGEATITATTTDGSNLSASCLVIVEALRGFPISITPASGSTVGELQRIVFEFSAADYPNSMVYDSGKSPVLYNAAGEEVAIGSMGFEDAVTYMSIYVSFDTPITAEGVYTLKVPEGAMREYGYGIENPRNCPALELTYNIMSVKAESIVLDKTEVEIVIGESDFLTVTILPETASNKAIVWTSSDEEIAVVNDYGVVSAVALGEATITATTTDGSNLSASCKVTVVAALAESISLNMTEASLKVNETTTLTATVLPETATNKTVAWTSSNESVATVDADGVVTAIAVGEATITATTTDGSDLSASCTVTVESVSTGLPISVTPKDGSTVAELQKIVFEFSVEDYPKSMDYDSSKNPLLYNAAGEVVAEGHMGFEDAVTYMSIYVTFDAPITAEGVYTLKVPEGAMREYGFGGENPKLCPAMELTYTIIPVKAESITLDKTEVEII